MSDTRNHTTRDQLADLIVRHQRIPLYDETGGQRCTGCDNMHGEPDGPNSPRHAEHLADVLLASDAIAAVRAAAVAETTAAIEGALYSLHFKMDVFWKRYLNAETGHSEALNQGRFEGYAEAESYVRAALSGGRTALDTMPPVDPDDLCLTCGATNGVCGSPKPAEEQPR